ncbi:hypothetical protein LZ554_002434 [Drepanopeziza brunnea f. sp. 'monogermtubi']|nr:hypothetical protein LZ554_002434 [Drepanopeziza brunnea f. sp. 'monogermtubi']
MADILAAFDELEKKDKASRPVKSTNKKFVNPLKTSGSRRVGRSQSRSTNPGGRATKPVDQLDAQTSSQGERSPSSVSNRRISFVAPDLPNRAPRRIRVPTKKDSLASGFQWEPILSAKYGVSENEWATFGKQIIEAAELPKRARMMWSMVKQDVVAKIKRDLDFGGEVKQQLKEWSLHFRAKGFTVSMELPGKVRSKKDDTEEERALAESYANRFRVVISENAERSASIYSRSSSVSRSVSGEGLAAAGTPHTSDDDDDDVDDEVKDVKS